MGRLFCHICGASGKPESGEGDESVANGYDSEASNRSTSSQKSRLKKASESMSDMISRIQIFMKVSRTSYLALEGTPRHLIFCVAWHTSHP